MGWLNYSRLTATFGRIKPPTHLLFTQMTFIRTVKDVNRNLCLYCCITSFLSSPNDHHHQLFLHLSLCVCVFAQLIQFNQTNNVSVVESQGEKRLESHTVMSKFGFTHWPNECKVAPNTQNSWNSHFLVRSKQLATWGEERKDFSTETRNLRSSVKSCFSNFPIFLCVIHQSIWWWQSGIWLHQHKVAVGIEDSGGGF